MAESGLNRLAVQAELQNLRSAAAFVHEATRWPRKLGPLLTLLAPLGGFLLTRVSRHPDSWLNRVIVAAKWAGPLYSLWKSFSTSGNAPHPEEPAV